MTPFTSLDAHAMACMERGAFAEAVGFWELLLSGGEPRLAHVLLYALCLARAGRAEDARDTCTAVRLDLEGIPKGPEREALTELLRTVIASVGDSDPFVLPTAAPLFGER